MAPASLAWPGNGLSPERTDLGSRRMGRSTASFLTSEATTAKPLPCSPARAAWIAEFGARRSVWRAISCTKVIF